MKRIIVFAVCFFLLVSSAIAETKPEYYDLEPGLYEIGKDIPSGKYDIRFNGLNQELTISYSWVLKNGLPDLSVSQAFSFTFSSFSNWWNIGGFVVTLFPGYIQIENSPCRLWIEK